MAELGQFESNLYNRLRGLTNLVLRVSLLISDLTLISLEGLQWLSPILNHVIEEEDEFTWYWGSRTLTIAFISFALGSWPRCVGFNEAILTGFIAEFRDRGSNCHRGQGNIKKELHDDASE